MEQALAQGGLLWRVLAAWAGLRASMQGELARAPGEGRLLLYAMLSGAIWVLGELLVLRYALSPQPLTEAAFLGQASALVAGALFVRTLALYGLAALAHAVAKALGSSAGWRTSRAALFWAALVAAPIMVGAALLSLLLADTLAETRAIAHGVGSLILAWAMASCIAEAHGFAGIWRGVAVVVAMAALILAVLVVVMQL